MTFTLTDINHEESFVELTSNDGEKVKFSFEYIQDINRYITGEFKWINQQEKYKNMTYNWYPMINGSNMIEIHNKEAVFEHFDENPNASITLYCPGSGSWTETFYSKEDYIKRQEAWNGGTEMWIKYRQTRG